MSVFRLYIRTDNAAFDDGNKPAEVVRILRDIADRIEAGAEVPYFYQTILDINGNDVGRYAEKDE